MKILTFTGKTPSEALKKAKLEIGDDAMLIETREIHKKALGRDALYEIVVGVDGNSINATYLNKQKTSKKPLRQESEDVLFDISSAASQISEISKVKDPLYSYDDAKVEVKSYEPKELKEIKSQINKLGDKVKLIQNMFWDEKSPDLENSIPSEFAEIYRLASQSGMDPEHLESIMRMTLQHMPAKMKENSTTVKRYFQTLLRKMIPIRLEAPLSVGSKEWFGLKKNL